MALSVREKAHSRKTVTEMNDARRAEPRGRPDDDRPGDPACLLRRVCPACGSVADTDPPTTCPQCGADLPAD